MVIVTAELAEEVVKVVVLMVVVVVMVVVIITGFQEVVGGWYSVVCAW